MSSLKNAIPRRAHKERAQLQSRKKFGLLEKHKDYVQRARAFHKKEDTLRRLREKAAFRNPDEFYFKMINSRVVDGVHMPKSQANKYSQEELMVMKTQDVGYVLQKLQSEKKKVDRLGATLHALDNQPLNKHVYYVEDREEAKEIQSRSSHTIGFHALRNVPRGVRKKTTSSYRELEKRKNRAQQLEKLYSEMTLQKELQQSSPLPCTELLLRPPPFSTDAGHSSSRSHAGAAHLSSLSIISTSAASSPLHHAGSYASSSSCRQPHLFHITPARRLLRHIPCQFPKRVAKATA